MAPEISLTLGGLAAVLIVIASPGRQPELADSIRYQPAPIFSATVAAKGTADLL